LTDEIKVEDKGEVAEEVFSIPPISLETLKEAMGILVRGNLKAHLRTLGPQIG